MLYINNLGDNQLIVTLYEKCSNVTDPYFTWEIEHCDSKTKYQLFMSDNSSSPYYYNSFTFSNSGTYKNGQYTYKVYEMATASNLDISQAIGLVENGILEISGTYSLNIKSFTQSNYRVVKSFQN